MALAASCAPPASFAQSQTLKPVVVTATRSATAADELVSDVSVIDRATIEASTARTLTELLARVPGLQMTSNGGLGKASSIFIRDSESRHTILLVDDVRLGSATLGTPSWDNIPLETIERIEVLKGPALALYGSDAVTGQGQQPDQSAVRNRLWLQPVGPRRVPETALDTQVSATPITII